MALVMNAIYTQTVGAGGASTITFNNIPQDYSDLKVLCSARDGRTDANYSNIVFYLNGNLTNLYSAINMAAVLSTSNSSNFSNQSSFAYNLYDNGTVSTANTFSNCEVYIPQYTSSNFKQIMVDNVIESDSFATNGNLIVINAGLFRSTSPITSMSFYAQNGPFVQNTTFSLYGIIRSGL